MNFYPNPDGPVDILAVLPGGIIKSNLSWIPPNAAPCPQTPSDSESMREKNAISNPVSYTLQNGNQQQ
jgi:hypothetical protein